MATESKAPPKVRLEQINSLSHEAVGTWLRANTPYYPGSDELNAKHIMAHAYLKMGLLDVRDVPHVNIFTDSQRLGPGPLWRHMDSIDSRNIDLAAVQAALATLQGEELVLYYVCRFLSHLGQTSWHLTGYEDGDVDWTAEVHRDIKLQGQALIADLHMGLEGVELGGVSWPGENYYNEGNGIQYVSLEDLWYRILRAPQGVIEGYHMMQIFLAWSKATQADEKAMAEYKEKFPVCVEPTVAGLIAGVSDSLYAHLHRGLIRLPDIAQAYLRYVDRVLMNYRVHGIATLRPSDLLEGDAIFSRVGGTILPAVSRTGLPTAVAIQGLVDTYLVKVPTDADILRRIIALAESRGFGGYPVPPWPPVRLETYPLFSTYGL